MDLAQIRAKQQADKKAKELQAASGVKSVSSQSTETMKIAVTHALLGPSPAEVLTVRSAPVPVSEALFAGRNLVELAAAIKNQSEPVHEAILIYGDGKVGKTQLSATVAKVPWVRRVFYFGMENGQQTLVTMLRTGALTPAEASKIIVIDTKDAPDFPIGYETWVNIARNTKMAHAICIAHGRLNCTDCTKLKAPTLAFNMSQLDGRDFCIWDTGTQLGDSIMSFLMKDKGMGTKPGWEEYGPQGLILTDFFGMIQRARYCNHIVCMHKLVVDVTPQGDVAKEKDPIKIEKVYPLVGTKNYSLNVGTFFGHIIYCEIKNQQHVAGSGSTYKRDVQTGSRSGWLIEKEKTPDLSLLFAKLVDDGTKVVPS